MKSLAIVGSGVTGALTAFMLRQTLPQIKITIMDKARVIGGRMLTSCSPVNEKCTVDLGAQYFTLTPKTDETVLKYCNELLKSNILKPMNCVTEGMRSSDPGIRNFVFSQGSGSLVKYFIKSSGCDVRFSEKVTEIKPSGIDRWAIKSDISSEEEEFDAVVFTIPVPQVLQIQGMLNVLTEDHIQNLKKVSYNSRFALGIYFDENSTVIHDLPWDKKYFDDNCVIRFISANSKKQGMTSESASLVVHSTKEFGKIHIDDDIIEIEKLLMTHLQHVIPNLPTPSHVKCHRWKYSQVEESFPGSPGCLAVSDKPLLICGGDGFSHSGFEGCVYSAQKIVEGISKCTQNMKT